MQVKTYEELVGTRLLHNIIDSKGMMLVPIDTIIKTGHIKILERFNVEVYDVHVELVEEEEEQTVAAAGNNIPASVEVKKSQTGELVKKTDQKMQEIEKIIQNTGQIPITYIEENVLPAIQEATHQRNIYAIFSGLKSEKDFRFKHSLGVAFIATMIGRWMKLEDKELKVLTTAASLCDIGTVKLPSSLVQKTSELLPEEYELLKQHTTFGYELLKDSDLDRRVALVALQHHEREDGSGYPAQLTGSQIDPFSKIVAIADVYLAMTSERPHRASLPFYEVIQKLYEDIVHNRLDSRIGLIFLNRLMSAQVGNDVILTDNRRGKIILINANYPTSPLICVDDEFIDLSKTDSVRIKEIEG